MTQPAPPGIEPAQHAAWQEYERRHAGSKVELARLDARSAWIANARAATFVAALGIAGLVVFDKLPRIAWALAGAFFAGFAALAWWHDRVFAAERRAKVRVELNERALARLSGQWRLFSGKGERFAGGAHLYTPDLDVFGQGSLFQLLDETSTAGGEAELANWLSAPAEREVVRHRQGAARELEPQLDFRQALAIEGRLAMKDKADAARFIAWAEGGPLLARIGWARFAGYLLPPLTLLGYLASRLELVEFPLHFVGLGLQLVVVLLTRKRVGELYNRISAGEGGFVRFGPVFATLESRSFLHPRLAALRGGLEVAGAPVSRRFASFAWLLAFAELRQSAQMHAVINWLLLWDLQTFFRLEDWRARNGEKVRGWFKALFEVEALCSIAGYAHDHPQYIFPELAAEGPVFTAKALGHPLLDRPVRNDVALSGPSHALVVTGSNMSGKTTLLRAMGLNAVMALAGLPVCAEALHCSSLAVLTSMRVKDSLERGVSYFYAEVQRMKAVLDAAAAAGGRAMFLIDELLLGTNTRERQIASREVVRRLLDTGAIGAVTTHDLSLTELASPGGKVRNVHFQDQLSDGKMTFDYRLREGVVEGTNALRVLQLAGIAIRDDEAAKG